MTRLLSDLLGAPQPAFSQQLKQLERASGEPRADIQLSVDILHRSQQKLRELGLDPNDTTAPELYKALELRLLADNDRLYYHLGISSGASSPEILAAVVQFAAKLDVPRSCFALKNSVAKRLLKRIPPQHAMRELGYRSADSMIKHEPVAHIYAAALVYESRSWHTDFRAQYAALHPSDFETRQAVVLFPRAKRWEKVATKFAQQHRHIGVVFKELGASVLLPVTVDIPALGLTSLLLILDNLNAIRCASTYLKLQQVGMGFGIAIQQAASSEPAVMVSLTAQPLPWRVVQYFYHKIRDAYHPALFEPHVQPEDLYLAEAEAALAKNIPSLSFWEDSAGLAHEHQGQIVSLNMLDVAMSTANHLAFEQRLLQAAREHIWSDVMVRYLQYREHEVVEQLANQPEPVAIAEESQV